jgi:hypothetical protein
MECLDEVSMLWSTAPEAGGNVVLETLAPHHNSKLQDGERPFGACVTRQRPSPKGATQVKVKLLHIKPVTADSQGRCLQDSRPAQLGVST